MTHTSGLRTLAALLIFSTLSCGTITKTSEAEIRFNSAPSGASIVRNGNEIGRTPAAIKLARKTGHTLTFKLDGYADVNVEIKQQFDFATTILGNVIFGGIIGIIVDLSTGAAYSLTPADVEANFNKLSTMAGQQKAGEYTVIMMTQAEWDALKVR